MPKPIKSVWFASPTTLMSTLTIVQMILKRHSKETNTQKVIQEEVEQTRD